MALASREGDTVRIEDSKKSKLAHLLGTSLGEFSVIYCNFEARQHYYTEDAASSERGFFGKEDPGAKWRCNGLFDLVWRLCRFEMLYFGTNRTIWDVTIQPICIYISRRVSGIFDTPAINDPKLPKNWKASGYFGFGKVALISPSSLVDKFMSEITNLSVVAALFLTITIPLLIDGDIIVLLDDNYKKFFFILLAGSSVIGQLSTAVIALSLVTNLNKCVGDESCVLFVLSIFNPRNGITGIMGVALYLGAIFSWVMTIWCTLYLVFLQFGTDGADVVWGIMYLLFIMVGFFLYAIALVYGTSAENVCSKANLNKVCTLKRADLVETYISTKEKLDSAVYTKQFDPVTEFRGLSADDKKALMQLINDE